MKTITFLFEFLAKFSLHFEGYRPHNLITEELSEATVQLLKLEGTDPITEELSKAIMQLLKLEGPYF